MGQTRPAEARCVVFAAPPVQSERESEGRERTRERGQPKGTRKINGWSAGASLPPMLQIRLKRAVKAVLGAMSWASAAAKWPKT